MQRMELDQTVLDGREIDLRGRGQLWMRGEHIGDCGADIAVKQRQYPLHKGQGQAQYAHGALHA
jgi:hypothetical protein